MYYVTRYGKRLDEYHVAFETKESAIDYAKRMKNMLRHNYEVIFVERVWDTKSIKAKGA